MNCPLCLEENITFIFLQKQFNRKFYRCNCCELHFVDKLSLLKKNEEKQRYDNHQNSVKDSGYVAFLSKLLDPVLGFVKNDKASGLDFGSGPYPMLQELAFDKGYRMSIYDPIYADDESVLKKKYDFITCCEVVEHFHNPYESFSKIVSSLKEHAIFGVMTSILYPEIDFQNWHYIKDDTHVCLYTPKTIDWISKKWSLELIYHQKNVVIFQSFLKMNG